MATRRETSLGQEGAASPSSRGLDCGDIDLPHRHHRLERALCLSTTSCERIGQRARRDLPGEPPTVLAPTARAIRAAVADDRVPVAIRLLLIVGCDLKGERLAVFERRAAVETEAGDAQHGELYRQHIASLATRVISGCLVHGDHLTGREGGGVEVRGVIAPRLCLSSIGRSTTSRIDIT